jgi:hypothetical protein
VPIDGGELGQVGINHAARNHHASHAPFKATRLQFFIVRHVDSKVNLQAVSSLITDREPSLAF